MNKRDYLAELDALQTPSELRARITAMDAPRTVRRALPWSWGHILSAAACLVLFVGVALVLPVVLRSMGEPHGEVKTPPPITLPTPTPTQEVPSLSAIPDEELTALLSALYPEVAILPENPGLTEYDQSGDSWELLFSCAQGEYTLGALRYTCAIHAGGYGNLLLAAFHSSTRAAAPEAQVLRGDECELFTWTDPSTGLFHILADSHFEQQGWQSYSVGLFDFDGTELTVHRTLPPEAYSPRGPLPDGAEDMFNIGSEGYAAFWADRKGIISGDGLELYDRDGDNPNAGADSWIFDRHVNLGLGHPGEQSIQDDYSDAFYSYHSPVLPITMAPDEVDLRGLHTERIVTFDFTDPLYPDYEADGTSAPLPLVTDRYTVYNDSDEVALFRFFAPWASYLCMGEERLLPTIRILEGEPIREYTGVNPGATVMLPGAPNNVYGELPDFGAYTFLLENTGVDGYLYESLLPRRFTIRDLGVTVYDVTDIHSPGEWSDYLDVSFTLSDPDAQIFSYGFNGHESPATSADGRMHYGFFCNDNMRPLHRLIVLGGKLENASVTGYKDGSLSEAVPGFTARLSDGQESYFWAEAISPVLEDYFYERPEQPLYDLVSLQECAADLVWNSARSQTMLEEGWNTSDPSYDLTPIVDETLYPNGWFRLEDIFDLAERHKRIFYYDSAVSIPAHGQATIEVSYYYQPGTSLNYMDSHDRPEECFYGYDLAVSAGSSLKFDSLDVQVITGGRVGILTDNMQLQLYEGSSSTDATQLYTASPTVTPDRTHYYFTAHLSPKD